MKLFDPNKFLIVAGPCMLENEKVCRQAAEEMIKIQDAKLPVTLVFSGSFDKANRTSINSKRGPGVDEGIALLGLIKQEYGFPVITDYHLPEQAAPLATVCDALQVPAFLCRQTDLLLAGAKTGKVINVKKGQFLSPQEITFAADKLKSAGTSEIWLTERGTTFGYNNLVVDMRSFSTMTKNNCATIYDATHSIALPGAANGKTSGQREFLFPLARAAAGAGAQGLYIEAHPNPNEALSDADCQLPLKYLRQLIEECVHIWSYLKDRPNLCTK